jgi:uncharacterized YccA/Bax inhibitor family protein
MRFWKRLGAALLAMLIASLVAMALWELAFATRIPGYLSGVVGGLAALGAWELSKGRL